MNCVMFRSSFCPFKSQQKQQPVDSNVGEGACIGSIFNSILYSALQNLSNSQALRLPNMEVNVQRSYWPLLTVVQHPDTEWQTEHIL